MKLIDLFTSRLMPVRALLLLFPTLFFFSSAIAFQPGRTITGTITDENNNPLQGVTVQVKGTKRVILTGTNGTFSIPVTSASPVLQITYVGYEPAELTPGGEDRIDAKLAPLTKQLSDVVVTGYGKSSKRDITGAV